ncbi:MAG: hypothetical protein PF501_18945 [Salinisphaera sp.]|jgi:hypothetical protein|nr:hypothetical protein [Salinisphaera sp.]
MKHHMSQHVAERLQLAACLLVMVVGGWLINYVAAPDVHAQINPAHTGAVCWGERAAVKSCES